MYTGWYTPLAFSTIEHTDIRQGLILLNTLIQEKSIKKKKKTNVLTKRSEERSSEVVFYF